jgi:glycosyltransferase involved in cell wall biosynthesis
MNGKMSVNSAIIFPFYNEENRIDVFLLEDFINSIGIDVIFINDGSTDRSKELIAEVLARINVKFTLINLEKNVGKTNAIRVAILESIKNGYAFILTQDLDIPYSSSDAINALNLIDSTSADIFSGARVRLAGSGIRRAPLRQWAGRVIATIIFIFYSKEFYDPQSPCKVYKVSSIQSALQRRFKSRWFGDVELLYRLKKAKHDVICKEFVLNDWQDKPDGKLGIRSVFSVIWDLIKIRFT